MPSLNDELLFDPPVRPLVLVEDAAQLRDEEAVILVDVCLCRLPGRLCCLSFRKHIGEQFGIGPQAVGG